MFCSHSSTEQITRQLHIKEILRNKLSCSSQQKNPRREALQAAERASRAGGQFRGLLYPPVELLKKKGRSCSSKSKTTKKFFL